MHLQLDYIIDVKLTGRPKGYIRQFGIYLELCLEKWQIKV